MLCQNVQHVEHRPDQKRRYVWNVNVYFTGPMENFIVGHHASKRPIEKEKWQVYALIDPRDNKAFYIGCSTRLSSRMTGHRSDWASAAKHRMDDIKNVGMKATHKVLLTFYKKWCALRFEREMIIVLDNQLVNREKREPRMYTKDGERIPMCLGEPIYPEGYHQ